MPQFRSDWNEKNKPAANKRRLDFIAQLKCILKEAHKKCSQPSGANVRGEEKLTHRGTNLMLFTAKLDWLLEHPPEAI